MTPPSQWNKPARSQQSCGNCNAYLPNKASNPRAGQPRQGWCRAAPPMLMQGMAPAPGSIMSASGPQMVPVLQGMWPPTNEDAWCRAWESDDDGQPTAS